MSLRRKKITMRRKKKKNKKDYTTRRRKGQKWHASRKQRKKWPSGTKNVETRQQKNFHVRQRKVWVHTSRHSATVLLCTCTRGDMRNMGTKKKGKRGTDDDDDGDMFKKDGNNGGYCLGRKKNSAWNFTKTKDRVIDPRENVKCVAYCCRCFV